MILYWLIRWARQFSLPTFVPSGDHHAAHPCQPWPLFLVARLRSYLRRLCQRYFHKRRWLQRTGYRLA